MLCPCVVISATFYIDDDICPQIGSGTRENPFCSIQSGINPATAGDTVLVAPGTYTESIDFHAKAITVRSDSDFDPATYDISPETTIIRGSLTEPAVNFKTYEPSAATLNGFTIINENEGGIYCSESSPTIKNCTITGENSVSSKGGIYCFSSSPTITNCTIAENLNNEASGGGIYCSESSPTITNCVISDNSAKGVGGGIFCYKSSPTIYNCAILGNNSDSFGGGIYCINSSSPEIESCIVSSNNARYGGGIYCKDNSDLTIKNCTISDNRAESGAGGGIYSGYSDPKIINCLINGNNADSYGGGIYCFDQSKPIITNCTISDNIAPNIGGIYCYDNTEATVTNSIIWGNSHIQTNCDCSGLITYSDIGDECSGEGNINENPLFIGGGDYHPQCDMSPCIDAGINEALELPLTDMEGNPRICNGIVDMGTYEYCKRFTLELEASYEEGYLHLDFTLGLLEDATWATFLILTSPTIEVIPLWEVSLPVIDPPIDYPITFPLSSLGWIWIYTGYYTAEGPQIIEMVPVDTSE